MRKFILILSGTFFWATCWSQVGINTTTPIGLLHIRTTNDSGVDNDVIVHKDGNVSVGFTANQSKLAVNGDVALGEDVPGKMGYGSKLYFEGVKHVNDIWMAKYNVAPDSTELRVNIGLENGGTNRFEVGRWAYEDGGNYHSSWYITARGVTRIGDSYASGRSLSDSAASTSMIVSGKVWASDGIIIDSDVTQHTKSVKKGDLVAFCRSGDDVLLNRTDSIPQEIELGNSIAVITEDMDQLMQYTIDTYELLKQKLSKQRKLKDDINDLKSDNQVKN